MTRLTSWRTTRRIAIDLGDSSIKLLLAEADKGAIRVLRHRIIDLKEEGLLSVEEVGRQLQAAIDELGGEEVALALPQRLAISQVVELPSAEAGEIEKLIERESNVLDARKESATVYGFSPLKPFDRFKNPHWVAMAREEEVIQQLVRAGSAEVADVVSSGNALISAFLSTQSEGDAVLVELGAHSTVLAIVHQGQGVYATAFPLGSDSFTQAFAGERNCSFEEADNARRTRDLFNGPSPSAALQQAIHLWILELQKTLNEWFDAHTALRPATGVLQIRLTGGGASQPGLMPYLQSLGGLRFERWEQPLDRDADLAADRFAVAYGVIVDSFQRGPQPASLLPEGVLLNRQTTRQLAVTNWICAVALAVACLFVLGGLYHRWQNIQERKKQIAEAQSTLRQAEQLETLLAGINREHRQLQPILERQKRTVDLLQTLDVLHQARAERNIWFVLLADRQTYLVGSTTAPADSATNTMASPLGASHKTFIAELCVPAGGAATMRTLSELVNDLKHAPLFHNVDTLPAADRQQRVDPKLIIPNRHFAIAIELSDLDANSNAAFAPPTESSPGTNRAQRSGSLRRTSTDSSSPSAVAEWQGDREEVTR